ncbi:MAG: hypothetical protein FWH37_07825, partial [Candidatus Bathyarchaeota archaeon]|nr:hypothetical protein [Candidatus Termiticorpusculum sp.]
LFWLFGLPFGMFFTGNIVACELYKGIVYWDTTKIKARKSEVCYMKEKISVKTKSCFGQF